MLRIRTRVLLAAVGVCLVNAPPGRADSPATFEVASIRPSAPGAHGMQIQTTPGGRFVTKNVNLKFLVQFAYSVKDFQITGGPGWMSSETYDVEAKPESEDHKVTDAELRLMVRALLTDRFKLMLHHDKKELPTYVLLVGKNGPKLDQAEAERGQMRMGRGLISAKKATMAQLANSLANQLGRNVIDRTGLTGDFDFELKWTPDENQPFGPKEMMRGPDGPPPGAPQQAGPPPSDPAGPSIFTALQEQLGLKLETQKGPVEILIIDGAERASEN
jgi:bla regulator protein blaR1